MPVRVNYKTYLMKKIIVILAIVFSFTNTYANDTRITPVVLESFKTSFKDATDVNWTIAENFYKAQFLLNDQYVAAYYDAEGHMIALTRNISSTLLPITLQVSLKNNYNEGWISDLFEITNDQGTYYFATVENGESRTILKSGLDSTWTVYKKISKK
jgi:hypothetical protein